MNAFADHYDVIVVGARCAGASTAFLLARAGAKVLLVDRQKYGTDTVSTHALMRGAVQQLDRWGILPAIMATGTPRIHRTTFHYGSDEVSLAIRAKHGVGYLCAPRRMVLDRALVDAAQEAGVDVRHSVNLVDLEFSPDGRVKGAHLKVADRKVANVSADLVIGADGRQSRLARLVGAKSYLEGTGCSGYVYGYYSGMENDGTHWYFEDQAAAGAIPSNDGQHCVFVGVPRDQFPMTFRDDLEWGFLRTAAVNSPRLRRQLEKATRVSRLRGFAGTPGFLRQSFGAGWALVGDAGYFKDPLTAHGITDALRDAELLSHAVLDGRPQAFAAYQDERDALSMPLFNVTDAIASFDHSLDQVKELHGTLSKAMNAESEEVARFSTPGTLAA